MFTRFSWALSMWLKLAIVVIFAAVFFVLAERRLSRTE